MSTPHPYTGLRPFQMAEADIFFGRGEQIDQMLHKLETHRFLAVVGASGSGKSSLVRAGLLPALRDGFLSGAAGEWRFVIFRPGDAPFCNLAQALHDSDPAHKPVSPQEIALTAATLTASDRELVEAVRDLGIPDDAHLLVLVDQFEEIFRYRRLAEKSSQTDAKSLYAIRDAATAFVNQLLTTARQTQRTIYVVLTMRSDFLGDCDAFLGLPEAINDGQFLVPRLTREQMRATIVEPLKVFGAIAESGLVETLLNDTGSDPDQLPLLQHTLLRLWLMRSSDAPLSLQCYRDPRIDGLQNSLSNHADEAFHSLTPEQQRIAEKMFRGLCDLDNEGKWTRRWMKLDEIAAIAGIGREQWKQVVPVVEAFISADCNFLIASPEGPCHADTTIDISHEALIRQWRRMQDWLHKEQESVQQYRRLLDTARRWKLGEAGLWGSPDLDVVLKWRDAERPSLEWANRCGGDFELTQEFLQSSVAARDQQRQEAEERRQAREREIAAQKQQLEALQQKEAERNELQKTRRGRAELLFAERAELWNAKPEARRLPNWWEYLSIQVLTSAANRTEAQRRMMCAANRYHAIQTGVIVAALLLVWWGTAQVNGRFQARALHDQFLDAEIEGVPDIIKRMVPYRALLEPRLKQDYEEALAKKDRRRQLYVGLALLPTDPAQVPIVYEQLLEAHAYEVPVVRDALAPHKDDLLDQLWAAAQTPAQGQSKHRLRAAAALAAYDPNSPRWAKVQGQVAKDMVAEPGVLLEYWVKTLRPIRDKLQDPLSAIYRDPAWRETERSMATDVLAEYAKDQPDTLAELLLDADAKQFGVLFPALQKHGERGLISLRATVLSALQGAPASAEPSAHVKTARRQANAAVAVLRMRLPNLVWPLLKFQADPTLRSFLIHRLGPMGVDPKALVTRFEVEPDVSIQRALLQGLGEPGEKSLTEPERDAFVSKLKLATNGDDPGLRASAEWLLRLWGHGAWLKTQEEAWRNDKEKRAERFAAVRKKLGQDEKPPPQWYVTSQGQTMAVLPGEIDFMMGSPANEEGRFTSENEDAEALHRVRINRNVAISATPVTVEQYLRYNKGYKVTRSYAPSDDCPVHNVSWAHAANYCNWLSDQEGIHPDQWVYHWTDKGVLQMKPEYLGLTGYRLPTSAETEYACRAGTTTSRYFGDATDLLDKYAWHLNNAKLHSWPVATLKPNDFGLFDMHGNVWCWCQDRYEKSRGNATVTDAEDDILTVVPNKDRVMRGGAFVTLGSVLRSASSDIGFPPTQRGSLGFRVARTINAAR